MAITPEQAKEFLKLVKRNVDGADGRHLQGVGAGDGVPQFVYSVGETGQGLPEILMVGFNMREMATCVNMFGDVQRKRNTPLTEGEIIEVFDVPIYVYEPDQDKVKKDFTLMVENYYRHTAYKVVQPLFPDPNGKWAFEDECDDAHKNQIALTKRAAQ